MLQLWGKHPANYWGCVVAKELQALRNKATNPTKLIPLPGKKVPPTRNEHIPIPHPAGKIKKYADVAKAQPPTHTTTALYSNYLSYRGETSTE
jgi:hypothetical protein